MDRVAAIQSKLFERINEASKNFKHTKYADKVTEAYYLYSQRQYDKVEAILNELPDGLQLLSNLIEELKGKSVYKTLKKIIEKRTKSKWEELKGLFSLGTHTCIAIEKGQVENRILLTTIYERIGNLLYEASRNPVTTEGSEVKSMESIGS